MQARFCHAQGGRFVGRKQGALVLKPRLTPARTRPGVKGLSGAAVNNNDQGAHTHLSLATSFSNANPNQSLLKTTSNQLPGSEHNATVRFRLKFKTTWGQGVKLIGSHPKLGAWSIDQAVELRWTEGELWTASVSLPAGGVYEYKYVVIDFSTKQPVMWQTGSNAVLAVDMSEVEVDVQDNWGNDPGAEVRSDAGAMTRENKLQSWASNIMTKYKTAVQQSEQLVHWAQEGQVMKGEVARLKMELGLMHQAQRERDEQVAGLKQQNAKLQEELMHSRQELQASFAEALLLLADDDELAAPLPPTMASSSRAAPKPGSSSSSSSTNGSGASGSASPRSTTSSNAVNSSSSSGADSSYKNGSGMNGSSMNMAGGMANGSVRSGVGAQSRPGPSSSTVGSAGRSSSSSSGGNGAAQPQPQAAAWQGKFSSPGSNGKAAANM